LTELKLFVLGSPHLELGGVQVTLDRGKALALLVYLAVNQQSYTREALATLLWPDYDHSRAYAYLRRTLWTLKDALGEGWIDAGRERIGISPAAPLWVDMTEFTRLLAACTQHGHPAAQVCPDCLEPLSKAAELYRGDFLAGFILRDSPAFDDWQFFQAESLRSQLAGALQRLSACYAEQEEWESAILVTRRWLSLDPFQEEPHRKLIQFFAQSGQRNAALRQYEECVRILQEELGVEPEEETQAIYRKLKAGELSKTHPQPTRPSTPERFIVRLPAPPTPFVGRESELAEITELLKEPQCRLLSLVGPGGIGKTRLAIESAAQLVRGVPEQLTGGVYFVPLAPLSAVEALVPAIGDVLELSFRSEEVLGVALGSKTSQLIDYLRPRKMLLVMDNFEHLITAAELLGELVAAAPGLNILVTSRQRLNLPAEWVFQVGSLQVPNGASSQPLEAYSAASLFIQSARRARVGFSLSEEDRHWVARICQLVDGVPLAIELAAPWVKMLTCQEIAGEIQRSLDFLAAQRGMPERHLSLRAVFMNSWELLSEQEQCAFSRLAVFRGPFQREAAEVVLECNLIPAGGQNGGQMPALQGSALPWLAALVDKSLLRRASDGRYEMHELLSEYAFEMLERSPEEAGVARSQHARYHRDRLASLEKDIRGEQPWHALQWIEDCFEDIRSAWHWSLQNGNLDAVVKMGNTLSQYYFVSNRYHEAVQDYRFIVNALKGSNRTQPVSTQPAQQIDIARAYAMAWLWNFSEAIGEEQQAETYRQESLALAEQFPAQDRATLYLITRFGVGLLDDQQVVTRYHFCLDYFVESKALWYQAMVYLVYGGVLQFRDFKQAIFTFEQGLKIARQVGDPRLISVALLSMAQTLYFNRGSYNQAREHLLEALQFARQLGDSWLVIGVLIWLGQVATAQGQYEPAAIYYQEGLAMVREKGDRKTIAIMLACLGRVHYLMKEFVEAQQVFQESLEVCRNLEDKPEMGMAYGNLGDVARALGEYEQAREDYLHSLALLDQEGDYWRLCINIKRLGYLYSETGEYNEAWANFRRAMQLALQQDLRAEMLDILLGIAGILLHQGELPRSTELASLVLAHDATAMDVRESAMHLLGEIEDNLPEDKFTAAWQGGRSLQLQKVAEGFLP
jgi:predicted ATPase/DNA-binding SARP family transcriptional activator